MVVVGRNDCFPGDVPRERGNGRKDGCLGNHRVPGGVVGLRIGVENDIGILSRPVEIMSERMSKTKEVDRQR